MPDLAGAGQRGGLGRRVVADSAEHAAVPAGPVQVGVPEHVAAAVHARRLAVPHADDAVVLGQRGQVVLLAAPHRGGGQVLVDAGLPVHVVLAQQRPGALQGLVEAAQRGAGVTADEGGRPQAAPPVGTDLVEQHPGQGLDTGDEDAAFGDPVLRVQVKARCGDGHGALLSAGPSSSVTSRVTLTSPCSQVSPARKHASGRSRRPAAEGPLAARSGSRQGDQLPNWCRVQPPGQFGW